jgi:hypothetical protein
MKEQKKSPIASEILKETIVNIMGQKLAINATDLMKKMMIYFVMTVMNL